MPKIDKTIINAINEAIKAKGSQAAIARSSGITQSALCRYMNGQIKTINVSTWNMLYPHIKEFLPENYQRSFAFFKVPGKSYSPDSEEFIKQIDHYNETMDFEEIAKSNPLFGRSEEFINTVKLLTKKLPFLSQKTLNKFLVEAIGEIGEMSDQDS